MAASSLQDIPLEVFRPAEHLLAHLVNQVRPDGRSLHQSRPISIIPTAWHKQGNNKIASKQVQIGGSIALGVISLSIGTPSLQKPNCGDIECKVSMNHLLPSSMINQRRNDESLTSSGNSSSFPGDLNPSTQEVEYIINTVLNSGKIVDLTQLCIEPNNAVFRLSVHITILSYAGNLRDLCLLCAMLALRDVQLPSVIPRPNEQELSRLQKKNTPEGEFWRKTVAKYAVNYDSTRSLAEFVKLVLPVTCAYLTDRRSIVSVLELLQHSDNNNNNQEKEHNKEYFWFLDPTMDEERIAEGTATFLIDPIANKVVYSSMNGQGVPCSAMVQLLATAEGHVQQMRTALQL